VAGLAGGQVGGQAGVRRPHGQGPVDLGGRGPRSGAGAGWPRPVARAGARARSPRPGASGAAAR
jgi:hypothetical protein